MNRIFLTSILILLTAMFCFAQKSTFSYFDINNAELSKEEFQMQLNSGEYLEIKGMNANEKKLIARENHGKITNVDELYSLMEKTTGTDFDHTALIVVIYYPGKDENNLTGATDRISLKQRHKKLSKGLEEIAGISPVYIYKIDEGLNKHKKVVSWHKDPDSFFEKNFFEHHYPGYSFVVISPKGDFASYFGEFPKEFVFEATRQLL